MCDIYFLGCLIIKVRQFSIIPITIEGSVIFLCIPEFRLVILIYGLKSEIFSEVLEFRQIVACDTPKIEAVKALIL